MVDPVGGVSEDFKGAASGAEKEPVLIDKDLVAWFRTQGDLTRQTIFARLHGYRRHA
jgi:hypothetical protein